MTSPPALSSPRPARRCLRAALLLLTAAALAAACQPSSEGVSDRTGRWLAACVENTDCLGPAFCVCGVCSLPCEARIEDSCGPLGGDNACATHAEIYRRCVYSEEESAATFSNGDEGVGLCLPRCDSPRDCAIGSTCRDGLCQLERCEHLSRRVCEGFVAAEPGDDNASMCGARREELCLEGLWVGSRARYNSYEVALTAASIEEADAIIAGGLLFCDDVELEECNGLDDDCDGVADDDVVDGGVVCLSEGEGVCQAAGVTICVGGELDCDAQTAGSQPGRCDAEDDDCDGRVDEFRLGEGATLAEITGLGGEERWDAVSVGGQVLTVSEVKQDTGLSRVRLVDADGAELFSARGTRPRLSVLDEVGDAPSVLLFYLTQGEVRCGDNLDDDGDGAVDCADGDCASHRACRERSCSDGLDNDGDGAVDCKDSECIDQPACDREDLREDCSDGVDNDGDGITDCDDARCCEDPACAVGVRSHCIVELCGNGLDDDSDGLIDCDDDECSEVLNCDELCHNGVDDDGDGLIDCEDLESCASTVFCPRELKVVATQPGQGSVQERCVTCEDSRALTTGYKGGIGFFLVAESSEYEGRVLLYDRADEDGRRSLYSAQLDGGLGVSAGALNIPGELPGDVRDVRVNLADGDLQGLLITRAGDVDDVERSTVGKLTLLKGSFSLIDGRLSFGSVDLEDTLPFDIDLTPLARGDRLPIDFIVADRLSRTGGDETWIALWGREADEPAAASQLHVLSYLTASSPATLRLRARMVRTDAGWLLGACGEDETVCPDVATRAATRSIASPTTVGGIELALVCGGSAPTSLCDRVMMLFDEAHEDAGAQVWEVHAEQLRVSDAVIVSEHSTQGVYSGVSGRAPVLQVIADEQGRRYLWGALQDAEEASGGAFRVHEVMCDAEAL